MNKYYRSFSFNSSANGRLIVKFNVKVLTHPLYNTNAWKGLRNLLAMLFVDHKAQFGNILFNVDELTSIILNQSKLFLQDPIIIQTKTDKSFIEYPLPSFVQLGFN